MLTATYTDENDTLRALEALSHLPLDNPDNADFYNLFMQLLGATGSGKNTPNYIDLPSAAKQNDRVLQPIAQSIVASSNLSVFDKQIPTLPISRNSTTATDQHFKLYPNPTSSEVTITLRKALDNGQLQLYDITGRLLKTTSVNGSVTLNIANYPTGVYYVTLLSPNNTTLGTEKLIIVK